MTDTGTTTESGETVTGPFKDPPMTNREHMDPDKHWIGETLAPPTQTEIAATIGTTSSTGESPFAARADHQHKLDALIFPQYFQAFPGSADDATTSTTMTTWLIGTNITVPTWAATAFIQANLSGIYMITAVGTTYYLSATLAGAPYSGVDYATFSPAAINQRESVSFSATTTSLDVGTKAVVIGARRASGTGTLRADSLTQVSGFVIFKPA